MYIRLEFKKNPKTVKFDSPEALWSLTQDTKELLYNIRLK